VDFTMALSKHCVLNYTNPGMEEQPLRLAESFPWQFAGESTLFFREDGCTLNRNPSSEQHKVSRPLALFSD
jgi:hypothetical protein